VPGAGCPGGSGYVECPAGCDVAIGCSSAGNGCNTCP
jgi:hypothetical protein